MSGGRRPASILPVAEIAVTVKASGEAYVALVVGIAPEVRDSVALDALDAADEIPALDGLVLDFTITAGSSGCGSPVRRTRSLRHRCWRRPSASGWKTGGILDSPMG